jgi:DNA-directed RNA polymerase subunit alpha
MGRPELPMRAGGGAVSSAMLGLPHDRYNTPIEELNLSVRAYNCLKRSGLMTVGQVLEKSEEELLALRNFGRKSYDELRDRLIEFGYVDGDAEGLQPIIDTGRAGPRPPGLAGRINRPAPGRSSVILDEEDEEESLGALGKALKEALKEVGDDDLLGADDED